MAELLADPPAPPWTPVDPDGLPVDPALGGPLWVTPVPAGHGQLRVATDALLAYADRLSRLRHALADDARALLACAQPSSAMLAGGPPIAAVAFRELETAQALTRSAAQLAETADVALRAAIDRYSRVEQAQQQRGLALGALVGQLLGPALRGLTLLAIPAAAALAAGGVPLAGQVQDARRWLLDNPELITSPAFVEAVRIAVMSLDDAAGSAAGLPPGTVAALGAALGHPGVQVSALLLMAAAQPLGLFRETPVSVERVSTASAPAAAQGAVERLGRVPESDQVRIERYDAPGAPPRYIVYIGPTETFSPVAADEPWDLTSNVSGVAGLSAGSLRATEAAMHDAGVRPGDEVQFVGFSQGGLIAARLAGSGDWNAAGLETYGAPAGDVALPPGLPGMAVRNSDDFVPALAGPQLQSQQLQVERQAFEPGSPIPHDLPAPAHQRSAYVATATEIDRAQSAAVREQVAAMDAFTAEYAARDGSTITVMTYHAERGARRALASGPGGSIP